MLQADSESFICEIDSIHTAYEDMMGQNMRLLQQLTERDEANNQLLSERIKGTQTAMKLAGERDAAVDTHRRTQEASQILQNSLAELERRLQVGRPGLNFFLGESCRSPNLEPTAGRGRTFSIPKTWQALTYPGLSGLLSQIDRLDASIIPIQVCIARVTL